MILDSVAGMVIDAICAGKIREAREVAKENPRITFDGPPRGALTYLHDREGQVLAHSVGHVPFKAIPFEKAGTVTGWCVVDEDGYRLMYGVIEQPLTGTLEDDITLRVDGQVFEP